MLRYIAAGASTEWEAAFSALPRLFLLACLTVFITQTATAAEVTGHVVGVSDGDTLTLLTAEKRQIKVRLAEIDTPEKGQPYGQKARQVLADLVFQKHATLHVQNQDRYGRSVARVFVDGNDINRKLVEVGAAWVYRQYSKDVSLLQVEAEAKSAKRGLWALPEAQRVAPWEWRRGGQAPARQPKPVLMISQSQTANFSCSVRKTCTQINSCAEARFQLEACGNSRLDRDRDGIPCESLCN